MEQAIPSKAQSFSPLKAASAAFMLINGISVFILLDEVDGSGNFLGHFRKLRVLEAAPAAALAVLGLVLFFYFGRPAHREREDGALGRLMDRISRLGFLSWVLFVFLVLAYPVLLVSDFWAQVEHYFPGVWFFLLFSFLAAACLKAARRKWSMLFTWLFSLSIATAIYTASIFAVTISPYPFSLGWSESSQLYFASTYLAGPTYGFWTPLPTVQSGYEMLMAIPYLVHDLPIWVHRLWLALLWIGFSLGTSLAIRRNLQIESKPQAVIFTAWAFSYFLTIPVYFHLLACIFLVFFGFGFKTNRARWAGLIAASAWAGITRINWFPLPGVLAGTLFILTTPWNERGWKYFIQPFAWIVAGTATAFLVNAAYMVGSRNPLYYFSATFTSALLWYRLFPSATNPTGILLQVTLFSLPIFAGIIYALARWKAWHLARLAGLAAGLAVFFCGGLLVSVKIGGGNNIHDLDAFLTLLMVIGAYTYFGRFAPDRASHAGLPVLPAWAAVVAISIPLVMVLPGKQLSLVHPQPGASQAIAAIQSSIDQVNRNGGGEILFTTDRQLIALGLVHRVKLVPDYENVLLMEMAMGKNQPYYRQFHQDIRDHRFALILSEPLLVNTQGKDYPFGEENDAYVKFVSQFVLASYRPVVSMPEFGFAIYAPKSP